MRGSLSRRIIVSRSMKVGSSVRYIGTVEDNAKWELAGYTGQMV